MLRVLERPTEEGDTAELVICCRSARPFQAGVSVVKGAAPRLAAACRVSRGHLRGLKT